MKNQLKKVAIGVDTTCLASENSGSETNVQGAVAILQPRVPCLRFVRVAALRLRAAVPIGNATFPFLHKAIHHRSSLNRGLSNV